MSVFASADSGYWSIPSSTTDLGQSQHDTPDLTLVAETIFADELQLRVAVESLSVIIRRHGHRQAAAQWPGCTNRRADSNAVDG